MGRTFRSEASYGDLRSFYLEQLVKEGWEFNKERDLMEWGQDLGTKQLEFRKGEYDITIEYAPKEANYGWDYGIDVTWRGQ